MPSKDPEVRKETWRRWYRNNRQNQIDRVRNRGARVRDEVRAYKEAQPCADCGQCYPHYVMDFDHIRGEKKSNVADIVNRSASAAQVWDEIAKCEIVCANCHRLRTHRRRRKKKSAT